MNGVILVFFPNIFWYFGRSNILFNFVALVYLQEFVAKAITLPGEGEIMDIMEVADPDAVHAVRTFIRKQLAQELKAGLLSTVS